MIEVTVSPARIPAGAPVDLEIRLKNTGQDEYLNVIFTIRLSVGIIRLHGPDRITVSKLPPGQSITSPLRVRADSAGRYRLTSPNFSYRNHIGHAQRRTGFSAEIMVDPEPIPAPKPKVTAEPKTAELPLDEWRWDVALSFAGAQRDYVGQVAEALKARGVRCFYDADEQIELWGRYLAEELPAIYGEQAATVVVFVSAEYVARDWTRLERRAALARAVGERREYVLPARFDDTPLPGLLSDMVTVDLRGRTPQQFAAMIAAKLATIAIAVPDGGPRGAKRGANEGRRRATRGDSRRQLVQLAGSSGDSRRRPATVRLRFTSEGSLVRTQLRPPGQRVSVVVSFMIPAGVRPPVSSGQALGRPLRSGSFPGCREPIAAGSQSACGHWRVFTKPRESVTVCVESESLMDWRRGGEEPGPVG